MSIPARPKIALKKEAGADTVALGQVVSYTVTIKNEGAETINATLTDVLLVSFEQGARCFHLEGRVRDDEVGQGK